VEEAQLLLDEHTVKTQAMKSSPFAAPIYEALVEWEKKLSLIEGVLDEWLVCQMKWIYLEPVYGSEEILKQVRTKPSCSLLSERGRGRCRCGLLLCGAHGVGGARFVCRCLWRDGSSRRATSTGVG
jgi:hypothetical protein